MSGNKRCGAQRARAVGSLGLGTGARRRNAEVSGAMGTGVVHGLG
jgi:hypothetical protein